MAPGGGAVDPEGCDGRAWQRSRRRGLLKRRSELARALELVPSDRAELDQRAVEIRAAIAVVQQRIESLRSDAAGLHAHGSP